MDLIINKIFTVLVKLNEIKENKIIKNEAIDKQKIDLANLKQSAQIIEAILMKYQDVDNSSGALNELTEVRAELNNYTMYLVSFQKNFLRPFFNSYCDKYLLQ